MPPKRKTPPISSDVEESAKKKTKTDNKFGLQLPFSRIKRLCKEEGDIRVMSQEATYVVARATELFIAKLAAEAHRFTLKDKRKILQYRDLANAVKKVDSFDFLTDIVPQTRTKRQMVKELTAGPPSPSK